MELRLTSMWYTMLGASSNSDVVVRTSKRLNVCYSMHSSLEEIGRTIDYLRPSVVTPLVKPFQSSMEDVRQVKIFFKRCFYIIERPNVNLV